MNLTDTSLDNAPSVKHVIAEGMEKRWHIGAQISVLLDGECVISDAMGLARAAESPLGEAAMTPETIMLWLSSGKPLMSVVFGKYWEAGELNLDDRVIRFIPEFGQNGKEGITLRADAHRRVPRDASWISGSDLGSDHPHDLRDAHREGLGAGAEGGLSCQLQLVHPRRDFPPH